MSLIDRYLVRRFLTNFAILFALVFVLAAAIDTILQLDEFSEAVVKTAGAGAGLLTRVWTFVSLIFNFHGPRLFQVYAYLLGLVSVGAMGFTLAQMHRHKELVAIMASGVSLYRVAMPVVAAAFALNLLQLVNAELILPRLAERLIRGHGEIAEPSVTAFEVPFTADGSGTLFQAPEFDPRRSTLQRPTILERDERGRTVRRITADAARWDRSLGGWLLENGQAMRPVSQDEIESGRGQAMSFEPVHVVTTDLDPQALTVHRYAEFASMLSQRQIRQMMASSGAVDVAALARVQYGRYSVLFTNMLMLAITLPVFLLREPVSLLAQSVKCAAMALPIMLGAFIGMEAELPGIPPAVAVFLPVIVLIPVSLAAATFVKT